MTIFDSLELNRSFGRSRLTGPTVRDCDAQRSEDQCAESECPPRDQPCMQAKQSPSPHGPHAHRPGPQCKGRSCDAFHMDWCKAVKAGTYHNVSTMSRCPLAKLPSRIVRLGCPQCGHYHIFRQIHWCHALPGHFVNAMCLMRCPKNRRNS